MTSVWAPNPPWARSRLSLQRGWRMCNMFFFLLHPCTEIVNASPWVWANAHETKMDTHYPPPLPLLTKIDTDWKKGAKSQDETEKIRITKSPEETGSLSPLLPFACIPLHGIIGLFCPLEFWPPCNQKYCLGEEQQKLQSNPYAAHRAVIHSDWLCS